MATPMFVTALDDRFGLAPGLSREHAIDIVWTLTSPAVHRSLVVRRGWSLDEFEAWLGDTLVRQLTGARGAGGDRRSPSAQPFENERFGWLPDVQLEEWAGDGHFVHLVDPDRFATRLRIIAYCTETG